MITFGALLALSPPFAAHAAPTKTPPYDSADTMQSCSYTSPGTTCKHYASADAASGNLSLAAEFVSPQSGTSPGIGGAEATPYVGVSVAVPARARSTITVNWHVIEASANATYPISIGPRPRGQTGLFVITHLDTCFVTDGCVTMTTGGGDGLIVDSTTGPRSVANKDFTTTYVMYNPANRDLPAGTLSFSWGIWGNARNDAPALPTIGSVKVSVQATVTSITVS